MPKRRNKPQSKKKKKDKEDIPSLDVLVHKLHNSSLPVAGYSPNMIKLENNVKGKGRGFIATSPIPAGTLIHRSSGYLCSPVASKMKIFEGVPDDKQLSVNLLSQLVQQLEDHSFPTPRLHKLLKEVVDHELQPQDLDKWHGKQINESEFIAELFCKATNRPIEQKRYFSRLGLIAVVNSHQVQYEFGQQVSQDWGIFPSASFINHSCWPNCTAFYSSKHSRYFPFILFLFL